MKVPFFSKSKEMAQSELQSYTLSSSESSDMSSSSFSSSSTSPPLSFRDKMTPEERKRMEKLKKSSSMSRPKKKNSGKLWSFKSQQRETSGRQSSYDLTGELTETFRYFDKNGDGKISATELGQVLRSLGIESTHDELEAMVSEVDCDNDGFINLEEFIKLNRLALEAIEGEDGERRSIEEAFDVFDLDKDGYISADELYRVLSGLGEVGLTVEECRIMIRNVDRDGDELVNFSEFKLLMHDNRVC